MSLVIPKLNTTNLFTISDKTSFSSTSTFETTHHKIPLGGFGKAKHLQHGNRGRSLKVLNVGWDPEGILGAPVAGHIERRRANKSLAEREQELQRQQQIQQEQLNARRIAREARKLPENNEEILSFLMETEKEEMVYEVARLRQKLNDEFLSLLRSKIFSFSLSISAPSNEEISMKTRLEDLQDRLLKALEEYDAMASRMIGSKESLMEILSAKDKKATILKLASEGKVNVSLLGLLDQNISVAASLGEIQKAEYMQKIRAALLKYITIDA